MYMWINEAALLQSDSRDVNYAYVNILPVCFQLLAGHISDIAEQVVDLESENTPDTEPTDSPYLTVLDIVPDMVSVHIKSQLFYKKRFVPGGPGPDMSEYYADSSRYTDLAEIVVKLTGFVDNRVTTTNKTLAFFKYDDVKSYIDGYISVIYAKCKAAMSYAYISDSNPVYLDDLNNDVGTPMADLLRYIRYSEVHMVLDDAVEVFSTLICKRFAALIHDLDQYEDVQPAYNLYMSCLNPSFVNDSPVVTGIYTGTGVRSDVLRTRITELAAMFKAKDTDSFYKQQSTLAYALRLAGSKPLYKAVMTRCRDVVNSMPELEHVRLHGKVK